MFGRKEHRQSKHDVSNGNATKRAKHLSNDVAGNLSPGKFILTSRSPMMPEPTTAVSRKAVLRNSLAMHARSFIAVLIAQQCEYEVNWLSAGAQVMAFEFEV